jgi:RNA polymerase sigma factor (sigma-70 family)
MPELDDHELLAEFARSESEPAFAALVERYVNLVYSTALRFTGNPHHAEEITQAVFIILARKAGRLSSKVVLSGWLYQAARLTAANFLKGEIRRQHREQEAYMQSTLNESTDAAWKEIAPLLDEAMGKLGETDRNAVVLRFFENKTAAEVAAKLKLTEAAAHKRVSRALEKLRKIFAKRGVDSTVSAIGETISINSVQAAPVALTKSVTAVAIAKGAAASGSTLTLIKGALKIMAWTKAKTAIVAGVGFMLVAGTTTTLVIQHERQLKPTPAAAGQTDFPRSSWTFAGYGDPASAFESAMWSWGKGDSKTFLASLSPEAQQREQKNLERLQPADMIQEFRQVKGYHIIAHQIVTDDRVILQTYTDGVAAKAAKKDVKLKKVGSEWKLEAIP